MKRMKRRRQRPEATQQQHIVQLLESVGGKVYVAGTTRPGWRQRCPRCGEPIKTHMGTCQTPGIPDLPFAFLPDPPRPQLRTGYRLLVIEAKAPDGSLSAAQREFRDFCLAAGIAYVSGTYDAVIDWLLAHGYVKATGIPHYRLPVAAARS